MRCQQCGTELKDDVLFCRNCGAKVEKIQKRFCSKCGAEYELGCKFCERCGNNLGANTGASNYSTFNNSGSNSSSGYRTFDMNSNPGSSNTDFGSFSGNNSRNDTNSYSYNSHANNDNPSNSGSGNSDKTTNTPLTGNPYVDQIYDDLKDTADQFKETAKEMYGTLLGGFGLGSKTENSSADNHSSSSDSLNRNSNQNTSSWSNNDQRKINNPVYENKGFNKPPKKSSNALVPGIITIACIFIAIGLLFGNNGGNSSSSSSTNSNSNSGTITTASQVRPQRNGFNESTNVQYRFGNYYFYIPEYWKFDVIEDERARAYAETNGKVAMITISWPFDDVDPVNTEWLRNQDELQIMLEDFQTWFDECIDYTSDYYDIPVSEGHLLTQHYKYQNITGYCESFLFPSVEDNRWIFVTFSMSDNTDYDYTDDFRKMLSSIEKVDEKDMIIDSPYLTSEHDIDVTETESQNEDINTQVDESTEEIEEETTVEEPYETPFDYAYKRQYATNYYGYYLIDVDTKNVVYFESSCPEYPYYGNYSGDTTSQIKINFPNDGYYVTMTFTGGIGTGASVVIQDDTLRSPFDCVPVADIAKKVEPYLK